MYTHLQDFIMCELQINEFWQDVIKVELLIILKLSPMFGYRCIICADCGEATFDYLNSNFRLIYIAYRGM